MQSQAEVRTSSTRRWTTTSAMTFCACSSSPATRCSRTRRGWRSRCGSSADSPPRRLRARFLVSEATLAQRIVRAKRTLAEERVPFEVPRGPELAERLSSVLEVIYLIFNEGYSATAGDDWVRPALCEDALRLGRILAELVPQEAEAHGLVALMEIQASRAGAPDAAQRASPSCSSSRTARGGTSSSSTAVWPPWRAPKRWATRRGPYASKRPSPPVTRELARPSETDWHHIASLYESWPASPRRPSSSSTARSPSPWPRARRGPRLGRRAAGSPRFEGYHLLPSVRGDLLAKLGRLEEARVEFERAASLTRNARERQLLLDRARAC